MRFHDSLCLRIAWLMAASVAGAWGQSTTALAVVNAASYVSQISPGGIATAFGSGLPTDSNTAVNTCTPGNPPTSCAPATVLAAFPNQINLVVPDSIAASEAVVQVVHSGAVVASGSVPVSSLSPAVFTADNSGTGIFNGQSYDGGQYNAVYTVAGTPPGIVPRAVSLTSGSGPNILILYGTGWRNANPASVQLSVGGMQVTPNYAGPSSFPGLDQLNVPIPSGLAAQTAQIVNVSISFLNAPGSTTGAYGARTVPFCLAGETGDRDCPAVPAAVPSCTEPLPGLAAPYAPHGIFVLQFPGSDLTPVTKYIQAQPTVCGGNLFVVWSAVDRGNGNYNWTEIDSQMNQWVQAGKKVNLIVWGVSDGAANNATPSYVLNDPNYKAVTCQDNGATMQYPVYYAGSYQADYRTFIQAVMNRYGGNDNVGYIRFGLSRGGEAYPTCLNQMMAFSGFSAIGQFDAQWESYITDMTQFQQGLQTQIIDAGGRAVQLMAALNQYGNPVQYAVADFEATNAKSLGFGFGSQGLSASDIANYDEGQPCASDWCNAFENGYGLVPLELQTIAASDPTNAPGGTGTMVDLLPFALGLHAQIFEVYIQDLQVAYDPTSPDFAQYSQAYQSVFEQTASKLGLATMQ
ncbi:MAG: hypothetical protein ACLQKA_13880 [Bryobacteraceae bacterium]